MGIADVDIVIRKSPESPESRTVNCLIDTGAAMTVLPADLLSELGLVPHDEVQFRLADGSRITRKVGRVFVEFEGRAEYAPVAFGEHGDSNLLGVLTLEELRLFIDPLHRELHPLPQQL
ncbi:MAG: aspartyl protease family protein [Phycisphaerae bacterium]